ncbi:MAG: GIY-YIG nuclease family protein [Ignavibacteriales bacterium]|nr:GIY-YIG nuclease family protein [Ignavibacteriales bacterium]
MSYHVYILKSKVAGRYYLGSTDDLKSRVAFHNSVRARWTKRFQPWILVHAEPYETRGEAVRREQYLKSLKEIGRHIERIILGQV